MTHLKLPPEKGSADVFPPSNSDHMFGECVVCGPYPLSSTPLHKGPISKRPGSVAVQMMYLLLQSVLNFLAWEDGIRTMGVIFTPFSCYFFL